MIYQTKNLCHDTDGDGKCDQCINAMPVALKGRQCPAAAKERGRTVAFVADAVEIKPARKKPGLGDITESLLQKIGVTKERYIEAKKMFGGAPTCNCEKRKAWLNKVSDWWRGEA